MTILEYMKKKKLTYRSFSAQCKGEVSPSMLYRLVVGTRGKFVSEKIVNAIVRGSKNEITPSEIRRE